MLFGGSDKTYLCRFLERACLACNFLCWSACPGGVLTSSLLFFFVVHSRVHIWEMCSCLLVGTRVLLDSKCLPLCMCFIFSFRHGNRGTVRQLERPLSLWGYVSLDFFLLPGSIQWKVIQKQTNPLLFEIANAALKWNLEWDVNQWPCLCAAPLAPRFALKWLYSPVHL